MSVPLLRQSESLASRILYVHLGPLDLLVRRLRPFHASVRKRLVKAPRIYLRDSGILHALLGIQDFNALLRSPALGASWEGFVIETLLSAAPWNTLASF